MNLNALRRLVIGVFVVSAAISIAGQSPTMVVLFDEGHNNFHTSSGSYRTYAELLRSQGFEVRPLRGPVSRRELAGVTIFLSANPFPEPRDTLAKKAQEAGEPFRWFSGSLRSAYSQGEVDVVREWIASGGGMLLILDHAPHGSTGGGLARAVGVEPKDVETTDKVNQQVEPPMAMLFKGDMIGSHPVMSGVSTVATFLGQSLGVPPGATALLRLADTAIDRDWVRETRSFRQVSARGRAQAVALEHGNGRVVVLGEAGMLSSGEQGGGLDTADNRRLGINIARWLAHRPID